MGMSVVLTQAYLVDIPAVMGVGSRRDREFFRKKRWRTKACRRTLVAEVPFPVKFPPTLTLSSVLLQNSMNVTITIEADGKRATLQPGENMRVANTTRVVRIHTARPKVMPKKASPTGYPVEERLLELAARVFKADESKISLSADLVSDLNATTATLVVFILEMEKEFDVGINDVEAEQVMTLEDALELLTSKGIE